MRSPSQLPLPEDRGEVSAKPATAKLISRILTVAFVWGPSARGLCLAFGLLPLQQPPRHCRQVCQNNCVVLCAGVAPIRALVAGRHAGDGVWDEERSRAFVRAGAMYRGVGKQLARL